MFKSLTVDIFRYSFSSIKSDSSKKRLAKKRTFSVSEPLIWDSKLVFEASFNVENNEDCL